MNKMCECYHTIIILNGVQVYYNKCNCSRITACDCHSRGSEPTSSGVIDCNLRDGQCPCLPNVIGRRCDQCEPGYWNLDSGIGKFQFILNNAVQKLETAVLLTIYPPRTDVFWSTHIPGEETVGAQNGCVGIKKYQISVFLL